MEVELRRHQTTAVRQPTVTQRLSDILRNRRLRIGGRSKTTAGSSLSDSLTLSDSNNHSTAHRNISNSSGSGLFRNNSTNSYQSAKSGLSFRSTKSGQSNVTTFTTLSSVSGSSSSSSGKKKRGKLLRTSKYEEEISDGHLGINEKELNSMNKHIPALKGFNPKSATFRQHYYPEGGWGWIICICAVIVQIFTSGIQFSYGILYIHILKMFGSHNVMPAAWIGVVCLSLSYGITPFLVAFCRRKSTRLTAVVGGLIMALSILFASFANELHQVVISLGFLFAVGCCMVRETSGLMVSQYFKRKRQNVEIIASSGVGLGLTIFSNLLHKLISSYGWRLGLQSVAGMMAILFFVGMFYRSASLYHPQRRAILHIKDMSKKKGKDKNKIENKPPYFDFATLRMKSLQGILIFTVMKHLDALMILLCTILCSFGAYSPIIYFFPQVIGEGEEEDPVKQFLHLNKVPVINSSASESWHSDALRLQTFLGLGMVLGTLGFGCIVVNRSKQCLISPQYLLQTSILGIGVSILALTSVKDNSYHGYLLFVWMYGFFLGGFHYVLKIFTFQKIRAKHFPRGWSFVQGARCLPIFIGVPVTGYINNASASNKAGYYFSFVFVVLGAITLFFMDYWKNRHRHHHDQYCEIREAGAQSVAGDVIEPENLSQKLSDVHNSVGGNSVILSDHDSIKDAETLNRSILTNNNRVGFTMVIPIEDHEDEDDDEHSYHFRGKPEFLAGISEENLLEQLEIEYLGDITSCNKVENYLMCSEYEKHLDMISEDDSFNSSQAHSEQITAPIKNKKTSQLSAANHSFSEPDLLKLFSKYRGSKKYRSPKHKHHQSSLSKWQKLRQSKMRQKQKPVTEMPVILESVGPIESI